MEWYEVSTFENHNIEYVYDDVVNKKMLRLRELESLAAGNSNIEALGIIRKEMLDIMSLSIPRVIIRRK